MPSSTFRHDLVAGLLTILQAYRTTNPTLLRGVGTARPAGPAFEKPYAYVDSRAETVLQDSGIRTRSISCSIVLLDTFPEATETMDRMDVLVDGISDALTAAPHMAGGNTVHTGQWTVSQTEVAFGDAIYRAEIFSLQTVTAQEGRL